MGSWKAILFLLAFGQGMLLSLALIIKGFNGRKAGLFLGLVLYVLAMELLNAWGMQVRYHGRSGAFAFWIFQSYLILPLALWFFVQLTTRSEFVFKMRNWLFFLPIALEIGINAGWRFYWHHHNHRVPSLLENPVWFLLTEILPIIGTVVVLFIYRQRLKQFHKQFLQQKIQPNARQLIRIYGLFIFLIILTALWIAGVLFYLPVFSGIEIFLTICLFALGYTGYADPDFFFLPTLPVKILAKNEFVLYEDTIELARLKSVFSQDKIFTQSKLNIDEVAARLRLPARYVSYLINTYCNSNFNAFVNAFRVQEVIRKLADPKEQHKTILALALESGFNSKSSFNQVFKQHTGRLPSEYLNGKSHLFEVSMSENTSLDV